MGGGCEWCAEGGVRAVRIWGMVCGLCLKLMNVGSKL